MKENEQRIRKQRSVGLDVFRILCCLGVLTYHVIDDIAAREHIVSYAVYFLAAFCVPGFFLLSGYLMAQKEKITAEDCEKKFFSVGKKLLAWNVFWCLFYYIRGGEFFNVLEQFQLGFASQGVLPVAWFLFTYMFLMICAYPLHWLMRKNSRIFTGGGLLLTLLLATGKLNGIFGHYTQALWLHFYFTYFVLGMVLGWRHKKAETKHENKPRFGLYVLLFAVCTGFYLHKALALSYALPGDHYGRWYYTVWLVALFEVCRACPALGAMACRFLKRASENTFVVYLGHLPILLLVTEYFPLHSTVQAILYVIGLFLCLQLLAEGMRRLPVFRIMA